ncbi:MAG: nucleotidyl transferase AbiEii/AbiGii toxin family protein [Puia sp.]|nr:nucleotidyl transferase AbiEii/AbiGii toxin family protein [Puia sp.]
MIGWLALTNEQRLVTIQQAAINSGISPNAIEKDWWVTLTLKALFVGSLRDVLIFKGGTSLSKGWGLINRFSEDIDLALDPKALGREYKAQPTKGDVERLRREGCEFTSVNLKQALEQAFMEMGVPIGTLEIIPEKVEHNRPDKDPQRLYIKFQSLLPTVDYLKPEVQVEVSSRSFLEPNEQKPIGSILYQYFPNEAYKEDPLLVPVVVPRKTFLEKAFLLHEEFSKPEGGKIRVLRMSRHFYDMIKMHAAGITQEALADKELYEALVTHRRYYSRISYMGDYTALSRASISFIPPPDLVESFKEDYQYMSENMLYGERPEYDAVLLELQELLNLFRQVL